MNAEFSPIPDAASRRIGVEIEFAGLNEAEAADIAVQVLGGTAAPSGPQAVEVTGSRIGTVKAYLDTALRGEATTALEKMSLAVGRTLVPVEIVTEPIAFDDLPLLEILRDALRKAGAVGTEASAAYGFGVHFNVEIKGEDARDVIPTAIAFALLERWMRRGDEVDLTRRVLPFTQPYPEAYTAKLCAAPPRGWTTFAELYLKHNASRNRGLDMLPILAHVLPEQVRDALGEDNSVSARPAYHYRLPDSRVGDPGWRLAQEWERWAKVERLAADPARLEELARAWLDHARSDTPTDESWLATIDVTLKETA